MKKIILIVSIVFTSLQGNAQDKFRFGGGLQACFDEFNLGVQVKSKFDVKDDWGTTQAFTFYFDTFLNWGLDIDAHYNDLIVIGRYDGLTIAPLGGVNLLNTDNGTNFGLNLGLFVEFPWGNDNRIYIEPKYIIGEAKGAAVSVGLAF